MTYNELIQLLEKNGWSIVYNRNGHIRLQHPTIEEAICLAGGRKKNVPTNVLKYVLSIADIITQEYNSVDYYVTKIKELTSKKDELEKALQQCSSSTEESIQLREKLKSAEEKIKRLEESKGIVEQKIDAEEVWKRKITDSFNTLQEKSQVINDEYTRLKWIFRISWISVLILVIVLAALTICSYIHFTTPNVQLESFRDYLPYCSPYPIIGIILWISIYQMNKSQRQLIVIAEQIQSIDYVEGLLLALNSLSPDIKGGVERINNAIDRIIDNYLTIQCQNTCNEEKLQSIENKDKNAIPINTVKSLLETALKK